MTQYTEKPQISTIKLKIHPDKALDFIDWQGKFNAAITAQPGFVSLEFLHSNPNHSEWDVVQRFRDTEHDNLWHKSEEKNLLLQELKPLVTSFFESETDHSDFSSVTEVIITEIDKEHEKTYLEWSSKIHQIEAKFPGFRGVYVQSPYTSGGKNWITLLQFDNTENLDRWLQSPERQEVLNEAGNVITSLENHRVISPYAGWFSTIAKTGDIPPIWKQTMLVLLVLFPIVMIELKYLHYFTSKLNISLATFIGNAISVTLISFPMMPIAIYFLSWWLSLEGKKSFKLDLAGTLLVLLLYLIEIIFFWSFL